MTQAKACFVSDVHLGRQPNAKENIQDFCDFLSSLQQQKVNRLFLLGDIFDFWFEYQFFVPKSFFPVYQKLWQLGLEGVEIHLFAGNHDFALGNFFQDFPNLTLHHQSFIASIQGKNYFLLHGDGMLSQDKLYRLYKGFLYSRGILFLLSLLPVDWLFGVALKLAKRKESSLPEKQQQKYRNQAFEWLKENPNWKAVLHGHNHTLYQEEINQQTYISTGNWFVHRDFIYLNNNKLELHKWEKLLEE